jgi:hypothetical protein
MVLGPVDSAEHRHQDPPVLVEGAGPGAERPPRPGVGACCGARALPNGRARGPTSHQPFVTPAHRHGPRSVAALHGSLNGQEVLPAGCVSRRVLAAAGDRHAARSGTSRPVSIGVAAAWGSAAAGDLGPVPGEQRPRRDELVDMRGAGERSPHRRAGPLEKHQPRRHYRPLAARRHGKYAGPRATGQSVRARLRSGNRSGSVTTGRMTTRPPRSAVGFQNPVSVCTITGIPRGPASARARSGQGGLELCARSSGSRALVDVVRQRLRVGGSFLADIGVSATVMYRQPCFTIEA